MPLPFLLARVEQRHCFVADSTRKIRTFGAIALVAGQREVTWPIGAVVLPGDDMFDVERQQRIVVLMNPAVLTPIASAPPNQASKGGGDHDFLASKSRACACKIATKSLNAI